MTLLAYLERPAAGDPAGLLVLHHGRGTDERDLIGIADLIDPERRLRVATPRAPLQLPGSPGYHWYLVPRVEQVGEPEQVALFGAAAVVEDEQAGGRGRRWALEIGQRRH